MTENMQRKLRFNLSGIFIIISFILFIVAKEFLVFFSLFGIYFIYKKILHPKDRFWPKKYNADGSLNIHDEKYYIFDEESRKNFKNF